MANQNLNVIGVGLNSPDVAMTEEMRVFYSRLLTARTLPNIVWPLFGQPRPMPKNEGQSINFRGFDALGAATTPLTEGVTPDGDTLSATNFSAVPLQYGKYVAISDVLSLTAPDPILAETVELQGEQAALTYDLLVRDVVAAGTNVMYGGDALSASQLEVSGDKLTDVVLKKAIRTMHQNKCKKITSIVNASTGVGTTPINAAFVAIISAATLYDLKGVTGFVPVSEYPSQASLMPYEVGAFDEIRFILSDNPKTKASGASPNITAHCTIVIARDAFGIVMLDAMQSIVKPVGSGDDPLNQRMTVGWKAFYTSVILNQLNVLRIEHAVSA